MNKFILLPLLLSLPAWGSTGFRIGSGATGHLPNTYAISTGWYYPVKAAVTLNPRKLGKTAELFGESRPALQWTSLYRSVSQTMLGLEFPMSGVNERGLMIQATVLLGKKYPALQKDGFALYGPQWIQYHLDTSSSLAEVIAKSVTYQAPILPSGGTTLQFQVCDTAECAVLSFSGDSAVAQGSIGKIEIDLKHKTSTSDTTRLFPLSAIANHTYQDSIDNFALCRGFPCRHPSEAMERFFKAAHAVELFATYVMTSPAALRAEVFAKLAEVDQDPPLTTWNETFSFSPAGIAMHYKSPKRAASDLQWIDFSSFGAGCGSPAKLWWLDLDLAGGDQTSRWVAHDGAAQEFLIRQHTRLLPPGQIEAIQGYPANKTKCLE